MHKKNELWGAIRVALESSLHESASIEIFSKNGLTLRKGMDGSYNLLGKFSNRWRDTDFHSNPLNGGEIVVNSAHQEFCDWMDKNPQHALELWSWHRWGTARKSRANWWGYNGNNFYCNWPLTEEEAKAISNWTLDNEPGMSFGFYVFDYDYEKGLINKYRAFEASILPKQYAANPWASFQLVNGDKQMAFSNEQRKALVTLHGEDFVKNLESTDAQQAALLDKAGVDSKEASVDAQDGQDEAVSKEVDTATYATQKDVVAALGKIESVFTETVKTLVAEIEALKAQVETVAATQKAEAKTAAAPLSLLAAYMPKSIIDKKPEEVAAPAKQGAVISGNDRLARSRPTNGSKRSGAALRLNDLQGGN